MFRVGIGWDQHRMVEGRPLVLGGESFAHPRGLQGHSDGDVLTHAVCDALLGALGLGDLGRWFPDDDPQHRNAESLGLLAQVAEQMRARNLGILITDHSVRETLGVTDRSYIIHEGTILFHGSAEELVANQEVRRLYLGKRFYMDPKAHVRHRVNV